MNEKKEPQETPEPESSRLKRIVHFALRPMIGIPLIVVLLLCAAPFMYRSYRINQLPNIDHPFDLEAFLNFEVPDDENAYIEYRQAIKKQVPMKGGWDYDGEKLIHEDGWSKANQAFHDWLEDNQLALAIWKEGTKKPDAQLTPYREMTFVGDDLDFLGHLRDISELVRYQIVKLHHHKRYAEASEWHRAWFRFSLHIGKNGSLTDNSTGFFVFISMVDSVREWMRFPEVDAKMLKKALANLESDYRMATSHLRLLKVEYITKFKAFEEIQQKFESDKYKWSNWDNYFRGEPEITMQLLKHANTNWFAQVGKPIYLRTKSTYWKSIQLFQLDASMKKNNLIPPEEIFSAATNSELGSVMISSREIYEFTLLSAQVRFHCLRIAFAAEIHKRNHGSYPEKLQQLKSTLGEIPYDPFYSKSKRDLQYRRENGGFVVWSVGDDEKDELGAINTKRTGMMTWDDIGYRSNRIKLKKKKSNK